MRRSDQILSTLQLLDQKQFFFYVRAKLEEVMKEELKLAHPTGLLKDKALAFPDQYKEKIEKLLKMLDMDMETYPACVFQIISNVIDEVDKNHFIFNGTIPIDLVWERYRIFFSTIVDIMCFTDAKNFDFFGMRKGDQKKVTDFLEGYVYKKEHIAEHFLGSLQHVENEEYAALHAYLLYETTMGYVRQDASTRKMIIFSAFDKENREEMGVKDLNFQYDRIITEYGKVTHVIKASTSEPFYNQIKNECITWLIQCVEFYANKIRQAKELNQDEIQYSQQMKILITMLQSLDLRYSVDKLQLFVMVKFILQDTFPSAISKDHLRTYNQCVKMVEDKDLTSLQEKLLKKDDEMRSRQESTLKSGMFAEKNDTSSDEEESAGPPKRSRTKTPPPRIG